MEGLVKNESTTALEANNDRKEVVLSKILASQ